MIGDDTKIDNLVQVFSPLLYLSDSGSSLLFCELASLLQIGHNVVIGKCCMICGQVGIAGSATCVYLHLMDEVFIPFSCVI